MRARSARRGSGGGGILTTVAVTAAVILFTTPASANSPAPFSRSKGMVSGAMLERPTPVVVDREDLDIDCTEATNPDKPIHPRCKFVATYHLRNPTAEAEELLGAFYTAERAEEHGGQVDAVKVQMDGKSAWAYAADEQLARMDEIVRADAATRGFAAEKDLTLRREPFRAVVPAGEAKDLVFSGELAAIDYVDRYDHGWVFPAVMMRHVLVGRHDTSDWREGSDEFYFLVSPLATWAGDPVVRVRIKHWASADFGSSTTRFDRERSEGVVTESATLRARSGQNLHFRVGYSPSPVYNGGPLVGIGPRLGRAELHTRLGYELGIARNFILGLVADTNFDRYVTPALTLDFATPNIAIIIPSLSLGVGAAAQLRKDAEPRLGVRTQLGVSLPILSFTFPIDVYPAPNSSGSHVEGAFLTQLSF